LPREGTILIRAFKSTENKDFVRAVDCGFIKEEAEHHGKSLRYFGLPSEGLYDIIAWNKFLRELVAVEMGARSDPSSKQSLLISRALQLGYHNKLTLLRGEINEIILNDRDEVGQRVPYPFELVNLDYGGSVLYPDRIRIDALEVLINRQRPTDFLLLITSNVREYDQRELLETQDRIRKEIIQYRPDLDIQIKDFFMKINGSSDEKTSLFRQVVHVHFLIKHVAEQNRYEITCMPALLYEGSKATRLLHYIFRLRYQRSSSTKVVSSQSLIDVLCQSLQEIVCDKLKGIRPPFEITL